MKFTTTTDDKDIELINELEYLNAKDQRINKGSIDDIVSFANVEWEIYIETRSWGVKSIDAYATKISLNTIISYYPDKGSDESKEIEIDLSDDIKDFEIQSDMFPHMGDDGTKTSYCVESIEVDFKDKTITIYF